MNHKNIKLIVSVILVIFFSCDEPETIVTNIVHKDGSITRRLEMRNSVNNFKISDIQVPFDSTWSRRDSIEISDKGDTTWVIRAEKWFANADQINLSYKSDSGKNRNRIRYAEFSKKFRWFNTIYRFSEKIEKNFTYGYPVKNYMNAGELSWFYSPAHDTQAKLAGPDSLKYKAFSDTVEKRWEEWLFACFVSEWAGEFSEQLGEETKLKLNQDTLKGWEERILKILMENQNDFDSLWLSGYVLNNCLGEQNAKMFKNEADSALAIAEDRLMIPFDDYTLRILMPGNLIASNGFSDSSQVLLWPVMSDYAFTEDYIMWAESKVPNIWAWVVSGVFILFVITGLVIRKNKRG